MPDMLLPLKNPLGLLNAFAEARRAVPEATLALIGPQPDAAYLQMIRDRVNALGLDDSVEITGLVDTARIRREIAALTGGCAVLATGELADDRRAGDGIRKSRGGQPRRRSA